MANNFRDKYILDFHGVIVSVSCDDDVTACQIASDFSWFLTDAANHPSVQIRLSLTDPPYERIPTRMSLRRATKDANVTEAAGVRFLDSFGRALVIWTFADEIVEIYSADRKLLREKAYLMIMSRVGYFLDRRGLHRIHAMGVAFDGRAIICAMEMGGGKTTLTLGLMEHAGFQLLSDEVPLVSRSGKLQSFAIRLGVREDTNFKIPDRYISRFDRSNYPPKLLIDASYFRDRVASEANPGILFIGSRKGSKKPAIHAIGMFAAYRALMQMMVIARGVPELLEYVLRIQPRALFRQIAIYLSRNRACVALLRRSDCYSLELSNDPESNARFVADFVARELTDSRAEHTGGT